MLLELCRHCRREERANEPHVGVRQLVCADVAPDIAGEAAHDCLETLPDKVIREFSAQLELWLARNGEPAPRCVVGVVAFGFHLGRCNALRELYPAAAQQQPNSEAFITWPERCDAPNATVRKNGACATASATASCTATAIATAIATATIVTPRATPSCGSLPAGAACAVAAVGWRAQLASATQRMVALPTRVDVSTGGVPLLLQLLLAEGTMRWLAESTLVARAVHLAFLRVWYPAKSVNHIMAHFTAMGAASHE